MILTITMNPSVDIAYPLNKLIIDDINRVSNVKKTAGGKGLNVTRGIKFSGIPVLASGIIGGTTGEYIKKQLDKDNIAYCFYIIKQESRNCIAILHEGNQTEILESGPELDSNDVEQFLNHYETMLEQAKIITISGSLPQGFPIDFYVKLIEQAEKRQIPVLLDSSGKMLYATLISKHKPYLIKPNKEELQQIIEMKIDADDTHSLIQVLNHPLLSDIPIIVISLGKNGAFARCHHQYYQASIPQIKVINPVGSGDITLAGLAVSLHENESIEVMLARAMTMGMLNAMESQTGFVNMRHYDHYYQQVKITKII
ncbi:MULTISPECIES: hexose kinase [unclassified Gilliamella]|uniref:hexose kinase n=1 Tax=unclassified Gilliamella TaxID=2685620 RepID=UPI002269A532|nr:MULTISPECIES: hexose kinase [unclassified Gilliamella]MCX8574234.1 hexose kinase [Gilliamella sp. B3831]MCX8576465.1 hexose kinase [Gilliamella sp. B3815]MCX8590966.1 hexose kinase [Gilliamella sp. B3812]MCX8603648.1 hexose kinase [Gilliamella sp. B3823]MCX8606040.1 hexose kinase [Gilliamella sp. B3825]